MTSSLMLSLFGYLLLAAGTAALLLFPQAREGLLAACHRGARRAQKIIQRFSRPSAAVPRLRRKLERANSAALLASARRHGWVLVATALLLTLPVAAALLLRRAAPLQGFDERGTASDPVVASLLKGEALVPPPPLPPDVFTTREVALIRPDLGSASREWALLDAEFRQRLLNVYQAMAARGYTMALLEGYRSPERQARLQAQGTNVTNAGAYQSYHQFGLAADSAFYRDGRLLITEKDPWAMRGYQLYGQAAEAQGLRWGGGWRLQDYGHVELKRAGVLGKR